MLRPSFHPFFYIAFFGLVLSLSGVKANEITEKRVQKKLPDLSQLKDNLAKFEVTQKEALKIFNSLKPNDQKELIRALENGDTEKIIELTKKLGDTKLLKGAGAGLEKMLDSSLDYFRSQSPKSLNTQLKSSVKGSVIEPLFNKFPKLYEFSGQVLRDPEALPRLFSILKDRKRLLIYGGVNLSVLIGNFIWRRKIKKNKKLSRKRKFFKNSKRFFLVLGFQITFFIIYFNNEVTPFWELCKKVFL